MPEQGISFAISHHIDRAVGSAIKPGERHCLPGIRHRRRDLFPDSQFHLPAFPLLYTTSLQCKLRYGWSFGEASPLRQVARCHKPMLFIHGDRDTYVPFAMMQRLYDAKPEPKQMWIARGSIHAMSFRDHPQEYARRVRLFVDQYIR